MNDVRARLVHLEPLVPNMVHKTIEAILLLVWLTQSALLKDKEKRVAAAGKLLTYSATTRHTKKKNISGNKYFMNLVENMSEAAAAGWAHNKTLWNTKTILLWLYKNKFY